MCAGLCSLPITSNPTQSPLTSSSNAVPSSPGMRVAVSCHVSQIPYLLISLLICSVRPSALPPPPACLLCAALSLPARASVAPPRLCLPVSSGANSSTRGKEGEGRRAWCGGNDCGPPRRRWVHRPRAQGWRTGSGAESTAFTRADVEDPEQEQPGGCTIRGSGLQEPHRWPHLAATPDPSRMGQGPSVPSEPQGQGLCPL